MNVWLLYEDSEYGSKGADMNRNEVVADLNMEILFKSMARNDKYILRTVRSVMLNPLTSHRTILYRQAILRNCVEYFDDFNQIYEMAAEAIEATEQYTEATKKAASGKVSNAVSVLNSLELLGILVSRLEMVKGFIDVAEVHFTAPGLRAFYERLVNDYSAEFVEKIKSSLQEMNFLTTGGEITFSGTVGQGLKTKDIIVNHLVKEEYKKRKPKGVAALMFFRFFRRNVILLEDEALNREARELEAAGLAHIMKMYQNFIRELTSFFECLHYQLAFYIGAANLQIRMTQLHVPTCMPQVAPKGMDILKFRGLYDIGLAIYSRQLPVCNDLDTENKQLFIITGANQGGKSTYLRSIGVAQLMLQSGIFAPAAYYCNRLYDGIFTHFTRREDVAMNSGKLDEELQRMSRILNSITTDSLLLMNESFATTTEREGSKIATDVVRALYENDTSIIMVTHLFEFTKAMFEKQPEKSMFLSAERLSDGKRTYKILEKEPERTSYGLDLYDDIVRMKDQ